MALEHVGEGAAAVPLAELKAYVRIDTGGEDAVLERVLRSATDLCERFVGQWLIRRDAAEMLPVSDKWQRLSARPVVGIDSVTGIAADGNAVALPVGAYAIDIDGNGDGWVRVIAPVAAARVRVSYRAGLADAAAGVPAGIAQGIVRMAAEMHVRREGSDPAPPAAVTALWRPWRRMRLS